MDDLAHARRGGHRVRPRCSRGAGRSPVTRRAAGRAATRRTRPGSRTCRSCLGRPGVRGGNPGGTLVEFMEQVALVADADEIPDARREDGKPAAGVVTLMTLHTAKGLEFPVVFLTGSRTASSRTCARWATPPSSRRSAGSRTSASPAPSSGSTSAGPRCAARGEPRRPTRPRGSSKRCPSSSSTGAASSRRSPHRPRSPRLAARPRRAVPRQPPVIPRARRPGHPRHVRAGIGVSRSRARGSAPWPRSTSAPVGSSACCCATRRWRSCSPHLEVGGPAATAAGRWVTVVRADLEVQVRPGRVAGAPDQADDLACLTFSPTDLEGRHVGVPRDQSVSVLDGDLVAVGAVVGRRR